MPETEFKASNKLLTRKKILEEELRKLIFSAIPLSNDPLNQPNFDISKYVNSVFPDECSLNVIDDEMKTIRDRIDRLDKEIIISVSKQDNSVKNGKHQLEESKMAIMNLQIKFDDIKRRARNSENMVNEICHEITDLDYAKRNLTKVSNTLNDLQTIRREIDRLKSLTESKEYNKVSSLIRILEEIFNSFANYDRVDQIKELKEKFSILKGAIKIQVFYEFDYIDIKKLKSEQMVNYKAACSVIDALVDARKEFLTYFSKRQLATYELKFRPNAEISQLKNIDQRFQWFIKTLKNYEENYGVIYPAIWQVSFSMAEFFCSITKEDMLRILEKSSKNMNVQDLKIALKNTIKFENYLKSYFFNELMKIPVQELYKELKPTLKGTFDEANLNADDLISHYVLKFKGIISDCFEQYMCLYVNHRRNIIEMQFEELFRHETWKVPQGKLNLIVFESATSLIQIFSKARSSIANLNQSQAFFDVFILFKYFLRQYGNRLEERLDLVEHSIPEDSVENLILCCAIISTSEYCAVMTDTIVHVIKNEISEKYKDKVAMKEESEYFLNVINRARKLLYNAISAGLEPAFAELESLDWGSFYSDAIADSSSYVQSISNYLKEIIPLLRENIIRPESLQSEQLELPPSPDYFQIVCDLIIYYFFSRFTTAIKSVNLINEDGAQQLLTDLAQCRKLLESLTVLGTNEPASPSYLQKVKRETEYIEKYLKILWTPTNRLLDNYRALLPDSTDVELVKIMQLKGLSVSEQNKILDSFGSSKNSPAREMISRNSVNQPKNTLDSTKKNLKTALKSVFNSSYI